MNQTCAIAEAKLATSLLYIEAVYFLIKYGGRLAHIFVLGIYFSSIGQQELHKSRTRPCCCYKQGCLTLHMRLCQQSEVTCWVSECPRLTNCICRVWLFPNADPLLAAGFALSSQSSSSRQLLPGQACNGRRLCFRCKSVCHSSDQKRLEITCRIVS